MPSAGAPPGAAPYYLPSAAAVPGTLGTGVGRAPKAWESLSTTAIVLGCGQILWFLYSVVSSLVVATVSHLVGGAASAGASPFGAAADEARRLMQRMAIIEVARGIPFAACSIALLVIAFGIRRGRVESLRRTRTWVWVALGVVALSLCLQLFVTVPMMAAYQRSLYARVGAGAGAGGTMDAFQIFASVGAIIGPIFWAAVLCVWPIALRVWVDRLLRVMPDDPSAPVTPQ